MADKSKLQIFLAHANEDKPAVLELYNRLHRAGYKPWLDQKDLRAGTLWKIEIPRAIRHSNIFIACLSKRSVQKRGYVQREFRLALENYAEMPAETIYLIPLKLDNCEIPDIQQFGFSFRDFQWIDFWESNGWQRLINALEHKLHEEYGELNTPLLPKFQYTADVKTKTFTRLQLIKSQIRKALRRTTDISSQSLINIFDKRLDSHQISEVIINAIDNENFCRAQMALEIDWDEYALQIARGNVTVSVDKRWTDDTAIEIDEVASLFNEYVSKYSLKTEWILSKPSKTIDIGWSSGILELPELHVSIFLEEG